MPTDSNQAEKYLALLLKATAVKITKLSLEGDELTLSLRAKVSSAEAELEMTGKEPTRTSRYGEPEPDIEWEASAVGNSAEESSGKEPEKEATTPPQSPDSSAPTQMIDKPASERVLAEDDLPPVDELNYTCPSCQTAGCCSISLLGSVITCEKCGQAMKLTAQSV